MRQDYHDNTKRLIRYLGGADNVVLVTNCSTRLRIVVKDEAGVNEEKLRLLSDVMGVVHDRPNCYEIVVGPGKSKKYADCCHDMGLPESAYDPGALPKAAGKERSETQEKRGRLKSALKMIGDIFVPLIPGIITSGLCAGIAALVTQLVPGYQDHKVWHIIVLILNLISSSFMTYITAWAGYRAAERFGATPILGGMLGMITTLEGINQISVLLGLFNDASPLSSVLRVGKGGVLAVIIGVFLMSKVEKWIRSRMPESLDVVFSPLLTLLICVVPYVLLIMPLLGYVSSGIVWVLGQLCLSESVVIRMIAGYVSAALFLPLVASGLHHGLVALYSVQLQELGYVTLYPALAMAGAGQVGAAIALWFKAKRAGNQKLCSVISGALPAGFLGIGEPLVYGVTLPLGTPFITAGLGAGFGGALVMAFEVASTTWGVSGLLGAFVMTAGPNGALMSVLIYLAGLALSYAAGFGITALVYGHQALTPANFTADHVTPAPKSAEDASISRQTGNVVSHKDYPRTRHGESIEPDGTRGDFSIGSPADGVLIPMREIPDSVFASGTMGDCVGILPDNGRVFAPCDGVVSSVTPTKHALAFSTADGKGILVHVGIDTVYLNGKGFTVLVEAGQKVSRGDLVMEADLNVIKEAGLSPMVVVVMLDG